MLQGGENPEGQEFLSTCGGPKEGKAVFERRDFLVRAQACHTTQRLAMAAAAPPASSSPPKQGLSNRVLNKFSHALHLNGDGKRKSNRGPSKEERATKSIVEVKSEDVPRLYEAPRNWDEEYEPLRMVDAENEKVNSPTRDDREVLAVATYWNHAKYDPYY